MDKLNNLEKISGIQNKLIKASQSWALRLECDADQARELRRDAILLNHAYYLNNIPIYQKLAREENIGEVTDIEVIKKKLMFSDDIFKSYSQEWLDNGDFNKMNLWLSSIYHKQVKPDIQGVRSIDDWLERLETTDINVAFSSGTSGTFSFVPRDTENWALAKTANTCYLAPLLLNMDTGISRGIFPLKQIIKSLSPENFVNIISKTGLHNYDAFFLGFKQGRMGNQMLMQELSPIFRKCCFLYDMKIGASTLRCLRRGARNEEEQKLVEQYQNEVITQREQNYSNILEKIKTSTEEGQKVFIFGAPFQFKELSEFISSHNRKLVLNKGSLLLFGGGWKSFTGELMKREDLVKNLTDSFSLPPERILEGYSMTEISILTVRCACGRFHIPPLIEPVVFDDELNQVEGKEISGIFGFLDPLATSYPGYIITGDRVHLVDGECQCGLAGPALTEIGRAKNREIKGCGGIMGSIGA
jgi:hypothetical protein